MGCGKQTSHRSSGGAIIVVSSQYDRSGMVSAHLASPFQIKQELVSDEIIHLHEGNTTNRSPELEVKEASEVVHEKKDSWVELSQIPKKDEDEFRRFTLRIRSPTDVVRRAEERGSNKGFDFEFLNESSLKVKGVEKLPADDFDEIESIQI